MADSEQALREVLLRLQRLEDERAVIDRLYEYAHSMDHGPVARLRDCFTEDREVEGRWQGLFERRSTGNRSHPWKQVPNSKHLVSCPRVTSLQGDVATVEAYWTYVTDDGDVPHLRAFGRYIDRMKRCSDGKWRIWRRIVDIEGRSAAKATSA